MKKIWVTAAALLLGCGSSFAAYTITFSQIGPNVVATGAGTLNTAAFGFVPIVAPQQVNGGAAVAIVGGTPLLGPPALFSLGGAMTGPTSFGGAQRFADAATGDVAGILGAATRLAVPTGYVSQAPLNSTATWNGTTIAGLFLTPGTYTWNWGVGPTADSFSVIIPAAASAIPTLSEWALFGLAFAMALFGWARIRRR